MFDIDQENNGSERERSTFYPNTVTWIYWGISIQVVHWHRKAAQGIMDRVLHWELAGELCDFGEYFLFCRGPYFVWCSLSRAKYEQCRTLRPGKTISQTKIIISRDGVLGQSRPCYSSFSCLGWLPWPFLCWLDGYMDNFQCADSLQASNSKVLVPQHCRLIHCQLFCATRETLLSKSSKVLTSDLARTAVCEDSCELKWLTFLKYNSQNS